MTPSQIPQSPSERSGGLLRSQWLKSPITLTRSALVAQTADCTPDTPFSVTECAPSISCRRQCVPLLERLYFRVRQEMRIHGRSLLRLSRRRGDYWAALDGPEGQHRTPGRRQKRSSFSFLIFISNVGLVYQ